MNALPFQEPVALAALVPEGQRHVHLCHLAGALRAGNISYNTAETLLLAWNEARCQPQLQASEAVATVRDIYERYPAGALAAEPRRAVK